MDRKSLKEEYKNRKITGGIYRVVNPRNGMYLAGYAPDIKAKQNAFAFMAASGTCFDNRLRKDWETFGSGVFVFEALETLDKKKDQTQESFTDDLQALMEIWSEKLDPAKRY